MTESSNYLKNYDVVSDDVKFAANSIIRLKILASLLEKSQNMKDLAKSTELNYSSISSTLHGLEIRDFVYRESNKYFLSNSLKVQIKHVLELKEVVNLLNRFFNIIEGHVIDMVPEKSINELYLLGKAELVESVGIDAYKINTCIESSLADANRARCILPFYQLNFNERLNSLVNDGKFVDLIVSDEIYEIYEKKSDSRYLSSFKSKNNFLLIVTDKMMILGLFKDNGHFDQNRLVVSENKDAMMWANNLFRNFKKRNK